MNGKPDEKKGPTNIFTRAIKSLDAIACGGEAILTEISPRFKYVADVETDDLAGWNYTVRLPRNGYELLVIKTDETKPALDPDALNQLIDEGQTVIVTEAPGFAIHLFATKKGNVSVTAKATAVLLDTLDKGAAK